MFGLFLLGVLCVATKWSLHTEEKDQAAEKLALTKAQLGDLKNFNIGIASLKGKERDGSDKVFNEDSFSVDVDGAHTILGVYDGHGKNGEKVSQKAAVELPKLVLEGLKAPEVNTLVGEEFCTAVEAVVKGAFEQCQKIFLADKSKVYYDGGSTATLIYLNREQNCFLVENIGDSVAKLNSSDGIATTLVTTLTVSHKPESANEEDKKRIENAGGSIVKKSGISKVVKVKLDGMRKSTAVTRLFGQTNPEYENIFSSVPSIKKTDFSKRGKLILASDGLWDVWEHVELEGEKSMTAISLVKHSSKAWEKNKARRDDITILVIDI